MAQPQSILNSIKKVVGIAEDDPTFDLDIVMHTNSVFAILNQLGIGPVGGFEIYDETATWDSFIGDDKNLNSVRSYVYLKLRLIFDPPQTSFVIESMNKLSQEFEVRLSIHREGKSWVAPALPVPT